MTYIPGLEQETRIALGQVIEELRGRIKKLEGGAGTPAAPPTQTSDFLAREGQTITVEPPAVGLNCALVKASPFNRGKRITFFQRNANPIRITAIDGLVNGQARVTSNAAGSFSAVSDGATGWALEQSITMAGVVGAPGTPGPAGASPLILSQPDVAQEPAEFFPRGFMNILASNPRTGGNNVFWDVGQFANFGIDGPTTNNPQIRSGDATFRISAGGALSVISVGNTTLSAVTGGAGFLNLATNSTPRLVIQADGEWTVPSGGALGNVLTHQGAATPPIWAAPGASAAVARDPLLVLLTDTDLPEPGAELSLLGWGATLRSNPRSGGANAFMDAGDFLSFGLAGPTSGQIRSGDALFRINGQTAVQVIGGTSTLISGTGAACTIDVGASTAGAATISTGSTGRLVIASTGEWTTPAGTSGQVLTHQGAGTPPTWATPTAGGGSSPVPGLVLSATNQSFEVVSTSAATIQFEASFEDLLSGAITPGSQTGSATSGTNQLTAAPAASTQRTMVECTIINTDASLSQQVSVQKNIGGTLRTLLAGIILFPNERIEFTSDQGWRVFDSQGRERVVGIPPTTIVQPGQVLGLNIDAVTAGPAIALTGAQQGENQRYNTVVGDSTTGVTASLATVLASTTKYRKASGASSLTVLGIAAPAVDGQRFVLGVDGSASVANFLLRDNDPGAAGGDKLKLPHNQGVLLTPGSDAIMEYTSSRWHLIAHTGFPLEQRLLCRDDFTGGFRDSAGGIGETGWGIITSVDAGSTVTLATAESGHPGVALITGSPAGATAKAGIQKAGDQSGSSASCVCPGDVVFIQIVVKTGAAVTNQQMSCGLVDSPLITGNAGSLGAALAYYDSSLGTTWRLALRSAAGTITTTDTGVTVSANTWYYFLLRRGVGGTTTWGLTVGAAGALSTEVTQSTDAPTNTTPLKMWVGIHKQTSAAAHSMSVDLFEIAGTPARF